MKTVAIKPYTEEYIRDCVTLFEVLGYPTHEDKLRKRLSKILKDTHFHLDLAILENRAVGLIGHAEISFFEYDGDYIRILALAVDNDFQRLGIGSRLINHVKTLALEKGCQAIALNSGLTDERHKAHAFYEKNGFQEKSKGFVWRLLE